MHFELIGLWLIALGFGLGGLVWSGKCGSLTGGALSGVYGASLYTLLILIA